MGVKEFEFKNHEEWLAIRHQYIGGSDASAVIGMNPYKSAYTLWAEKTDKIPEFEGNLTTEVGAFLEEFVAKLFEKQTGKKVRRKNFTMVNDLYPYACANVDRMVVGEDALLEIKTTNSIPLMRKLRSSDEFPDAYYCQVTHYLAVTGLKKAYLAVLINCRDFKIYELERDEDEIKALMDAEKNFWDLVKTNTPPCVDGSDSTTESLKLLYPNSEGYAVDLSIFKEDLKELDEVKESIKRLEKRQAEIENSIKEFMGNAEAGVIDGYKVSYKSSLGRESFDKERLFAEHPEIKQSDYISVGKSYRTFRVTKAKEK